MFRLPQLLKRQVYRVWRMEVISNTGGGLRQNDNRPVRKRNSSQFSSHGVRRVLRQK